MSAAIQVKHASKVYGTGATAVHALRDVSLEVARGEVLLMMGPSGSGKTTLLSIMGGILRPSGGSVRVGGIELAGLAERELPRIRRDHIGFVFQGFNLFPALTALENVGLALDVRGVGHAEGAERAHAALCDVGLEGKAHTHPSDLSGGQKQRVAIARALVSDPAIVLADEPTAALDSTSGRGVLELLRDLAHRRERAVVIVTHDARAVHYADRIVSIEDGRLREGADDHGSPHHQTVEAL
jgi:putative ABC transport system ATP-binding protein